MARRMMIDGPEALAAGKMVGTDNSFHHPPSGWMCCILIFFFLVAHNFVLAAAKVACVRKKTIIFTEQEMLPYDGQEKK